MTPGGDGWHLATQPFFVRGHSNQAKLVLIGGPLVVLAAIGSAAIYSDHMV